jgi:hypothetical protein
MSFEPDQVNELKAVYGSVTLGTKLEGQASLNSGELTNIILKQRAEELPQAGGKFIYANFKTWKNAAARILSEQLALSGVPTINFILSSRHHAFSSAEAITGAIRLSQMIAEAERPSRNSAKR